MRLNKNHRANDASNQTPVRPAVMKQTRFEETNVLQPMEDGSSNDANDRGYQQNRDTEEDDRTERPGAQTDREHGERGGGHEGGESGGEEQDEEYVCRTMKKARDPKLPTEEQVEEHNKTHLPFRSWCPHCIRGRGMNAPHLKCGKTDHDLLELCCDYCFMGDIREGGVCIPTMVIRDRDTRSTCSFAVACNSTRSSKSTKSQQVETGEKYDPQHTTKRFMAFITELGMQSMAIVLKSDQEPAIRSVLQSLALARGNVKTFTEASPVQSSASNGVAERAIQSVQAQTRVLMDALSTRLGVKIQATHPIVHWIIEYSSVLLNRFEVGKDGKTAHERLRGKPSRMLGIEFGETVHFKKIRWSRRMGKLEIPWDVGVYVGYRTSSGEMFIHSRDGVHRTRTVQRLPAEQRWQKQSLDLITKVPMSQDCAKAECEEGQEEEREGSGGVYAQPNVSTGLAEAGGRKQRAETEEEEEMAPRNFQITRKDLERYGATPKCSACTAHIRGTRVGVHSQNCRERFTQIFGTIAEGKTKIERTRARQDQFLEQRLRAQDKGRQSEDGADRDKDEVKQGNDSNEGRVSGRDDTTKDISHEPTCERGHQSDISHQYHSSHEHVRHPVRSSHSRDIDVEQHTSDSGGDTLKRAIPEQITGDRQGDTKRRKSGDGVKQDDEDKQTNDRLETGGGSREGKRRRKDIDASLHEMTCEEEEDEKQYRYYYGFVGEDAYDDITGEELDPALVADARNEELGEMIKRRVWDEVPWEEAIQNTGHPPISTRWIDINKSTPEDPVIRSRLVGREFKESYGGKGREDLFAGTPPLEALKALLTWAAMDSPPTARRADSGSRRNSNGLVRDVKKLIFIDISKAYLYAPVDKDIYVELPESMGKKGICGRLNFALYGTRDAARYWEDELQRTFLELGFQVGTSSPSLYWHERKDVRVYIHGDDIVGCGSESHLEWVAKELKTRYKTKVRALIGPEPQDEKEATILNRTVRWEKHGIDYEADARHAGKIIEQMNMKNANGAKVPGNVREENDDDLELEGKDVTFFRRLAATANYLSADRLDIQYAVKEVCRRMPHPTLGAMRRLKKIARYLRSNPRMILKFPSQTFQDTIIVPVDSDWGGCKESRKSTSGGLVMWGASTLRSWSSTQKLVA